jgi:hypothetical protein
MHSTCVNKSFCWFSLLDIGNSFSCFIEILGCYINATFSNSSRCLLLKLYMFILFLDKLLSSGVFLVKHCKRVTLSSADGSYTKILLSGGILTLQFPTEVYFFCGAHIVSLAYSDRCFTYIRCACFLIFWSRLRIPGMCLAFP